LPQSLIYLDNGAIKHTPTGAFYSKLFEVFKNSDIYSDLSTSDELEADLPGVISKAVDFGDSIIVFSVNKLPVSCELSISLDNVSLLNNFRMQTFSIDPDLGWVNSFSNISDAWQNTNGNGLKSLPAYSLTVTTILKNPVITSTTNLAKDLISIYPNPTNGYVNVVNVNDNTSFEVFNVKGEKLISNTVLNNQINLENLKKGFYFIHIKGEVQKIVIE
jgi:hypothetical protein